MSRRNTIIIIAAVIILIGGGLLYFYSQSNSTSTTSQQTQSASNPFGTTPGSVSGTNGGSTTGGQFGVENGNSATTSAQLLELYKNPIAGSVIFQDATKQNMIRFTDRGTGNSYEYAPGTQTGGPVRITNTTIPKVEEAVWSSTGDNEILRYNDGNTDTIVSFAAKINVATSSDGTTGSLSGAFINQNIMELVANPQKSNAFGITKKSDGSGSVGVLYSFDTKTKTQIFSSPISLWNISWPTADTIALTTKPSSSNYSYLYFFNINSGSLTKILGDITGLSDVVNNNASLVAYSQSQNNIPVLDVYDIKNAGSKGLAINTLADKCVWGQKNNTILYCAVPQSIPSGTYPDDWYQGLVSFTDNLWMINTQTNQAQILYQIDPTQLQLDAENLQISPDDQYITFMNKTDLTFWLLRINQ